MTPPSSAASSRPRERRTRKPGSGAPGSMPMTTTTGWMCGGAPDACAEQAWWDAQPRRGPLGQALDELGDPVRRVPGQDVPAVGPHLPPRVARQLRTELSLRGQDPFSVAEPDRDRRGAPRAPGEPVAPDRADVGGPAGGAHDC